MDKMSSTQDTLLYLFGLEIILLRDGLMYLMSDFVLCPLS
jgi:hypothetical protein